MNAIIACACLNTYEETITVTYNTVMQFVVNSNSDMVLNINNHREYYTAFTRIKYLYNQSAKHNKAKSTSQ